MGREPIVRWMLPLYDSDAFLLHDTGPGHLERAARITAIRELLARQPFFHRVRPVAPEPAPDFAVTAVHTPFMVDATRALCATGGGMLDSDTPVVAASFEAALRAAGAVLRATERACRLEDPRAFCLVRPPGHHATPERAMGFCLLNNVAIAAQGVLDSGLSRRVLIFDHDVHHGNGTQDAFYDRPEVLYMSVHQSPFYPGTGAVLELGEGEGAGFTVNAPVPQRTGESGFRALLDEVLVPIAESFDPDLVLVSAGFDSHHRDLLGGLSLTSGFYPEMIRTLLRIEAKMVVALEGGYQLEATARSAVGEIAALLDLPPPSWPERARDEGDVRPVIQTMRRALRDYWEV